MFDQILGDMAKKQEEMKKTLSAIIIDHSIQDGAIMIKVNANKDILNININSEKIDTSDKEQLEDLLVVAINEALELAEARQADASQSMLSDILPGGMDKLFG